MTRLLRQSNPKLKYRNFISTDIENDPKTGDYICSWIYCPRLGIEEFFDNQDAYLDYLDSLSPKYHDLENVLVVFNGRYDTPFMSRILDDSKTLWAGSRFICAKLKNKIQIMDLCNHVDGSLESWMKILNLGEKLSLDDLKARCKSDTRATYDLAIYIENFYLNELGTPMKLTVGSSALTLFTSNFFEGYFYRSDRQQWLNDYERNAIRGGRVECFERGMVEHSSFDVNSMYLSIMRDCIFPDPNTAHYVSGDKDFTENFDHYQTIVHCKVKAPQSRVMCLPYHDTKLNKLLFPCGEFSGYWTGEELKTAIEKGGYEILCVFNYTFYTRSAPFFKDFAGFVWEKRKKYKHAGNAGMDKLIKKIGNSLYGKFGQRNAIDGFWGKLSDFKGDPADYHLEIVDIQGINYVSVASTQKNDARHCFPCIAAFILAFARIKLYLELKNNESAVVYCDTDSIKLKGEIEHVGNELGEWGFEYHDTLEFIRPKMYGDKCKGVPARAEVVSSTLEKRVFRYEKPVAYKESLKRGINFNVWVEVEKALSLSDDKRVWDGNTSEPIKIDNG